MLQAADAVGKLVEVVKAVQEKAASVLCLGSRVYPIPQTVCLDTARALAGIVYKAKRMHGLLPRRKPYRLIVI